MRKQLAITTALASAVFITGCANTGMSDTTRRTVTGAGVGALGGAAVGAIAGGHAGTGAVIGAGVGALGSYIWSKNLEKQKLQKMNLSRTTKKKKSISTSKASKKIIHSMILVLTI